MISDDVFSILRDYPRVYMACHLRHPATRRRNGTVTGRDASLLAHVAVGAVRPRDLARHLGLASSTVSEAMKRLIGLQLIEAQRMSNDARAKMLRITARGRSAIEGNSVLDAGRVASALQGLSAKKRRAAVEGLKILATAAAKARPV